MPCSRDLPCGGILYPDRALSLAEEDELKSLDIKVERCMNGHRFYNGRPASIMIAEIRHCAKHNQSRPCSFCRDAMKAIRQKPDTALCACGCGCPVTRDKRYATAACAGRGQSMVTRDEILRRQELVRAGLA